MNIGFSATDSARALIVDGAPELYKAIGRSGTACGCIVARSEPPDGEPRKFYYDGGQVNIVAHLVHELDPNGKQLRVVRYTDYAADTIRTLCPSAQDLRKRWANAAHRAEIIQALADRGISFDELAERTNQPDADPFDLLCHLAFNAPAGQRLSWLGSCC